MKNILLATLLGAFITQFLHSQPANAQTTMSLEGDYTWQSLNDVRIPGDTGTKFSLSDFNNGPFPSWRLYLGYKWDKRHEVRALYAPLSAEVTGDFDKSVDFAGSSFAAGTPTIGYYKFNSYRLTYAYHFESSGPWDLALGFTAKVRDATVRLTQGGLSAEKSNVGLVPLLNVQASRSLGNNWGFRFDMDGLAAPQGRAFDIGLFIEKIVSGTSSDNGTALFLGYRTIEGGADNKEVYNFAWLHKAVVGLKASL
jgi:hypothetical protein